MNKKALLRIVALTLCLILVPLSALAEEAAIIAPVEDAIQEQAEFILAPDAAEAPAQAAPVDTPQAEFEAPAHEALPEPAADAPQPEAPEAIPAEESAIPAENAAIPVDDDAAPIEDGTALSEIAIATADGAAAPTEEAAAPADGIAAPTEEAAAPADGAVAPTEEAVVPADGIAVPAQGTANPAEDAAQAADGATSEVVEAGPEIIVLNETLIVENDTWQSINVTRAAGFTGPLAQVNGLLTLSGVLFDGVPARDADLNAYFTLGPVGRISIQDDSALMLNLSALSFNKGSKITLSLAMGGVAIPAKQARWSSSNAKVAKVSGSGVVTARKGGFITISASYNGAVARCLVVVTNHKAVKSVKLKSSKLKLALNSSVQLKAAVKPADAFDPSLTWTSSAPQIVSVDQDGWIAGLADGKATITATASNGKSGKCVVTVQEIRPKSLAFTPAHYRLMIGEQVAVQVKTNPANVSNPYVTFASSNPEVAAVDETGIVTATGAGTATIVATSAAVPSLSATAGIRVIDPSQPTPQPGEVSGPLEVTFMDIGRNDGILLYCGGEWAYIDSGMRSQGLKAVSFMASQGVDYLKYYIGTHSHKDHVGGAPAIFAAYDVDQVIIPHAGVATQIKKYAQTDAEKAAVNAVDYHVVSLGEKFYLGGAEFLVLGPTKIVKASPKTTAENHNSLILRLTYGSNTFLLTGDATGAEFKSVEARDPGCLKAQVYKNAHHNGDQSYAAKLCQPEITVISTSASALPSSKFLKTLSSLGSQVYITASNRNGHVRIVSDGSSLTVYAQH